MHKYIVYWDFRQQILHKKYFTTFPGANAPLPMPAGAHVLDRKMMIEPTPDHFSGRCSIGCQSSIEWHKEMAARTFKTILLQRQRIWMIWSRKLFQFVLCGHPTPRCWTSQERKLSSRVGLFRSRLRTLGTHYHPTLDPAVLWTPSNDTSRPIFSDRLNLLPPAPLYLRTLWRYTKCCYYLFIIIILMISRPFSGAWVAVCIKLPYFFQIPVMLCDKQPHKQWEQHHLWFSVVVLRSYLE